MGLWNGKRPGSDSIRERIGHLIRSTTGDCERQLNADESSSASSTPTDTTAPATNASNGASKHTGEIVGGTIGGVAALVSIIAAAIYLWRRRAAKNARQGPGPRAGDTQYISPMAGGDGFAPLPGGPNGGGPQSRAASVRGKTITHITGGPDTRNTVWQDVDEIGDHNYYSGPNSQAAPWGTAGTGVVAGTAVAYDGAYASPHDSSGEDEVPLRHSSPEIEDFSRGFHDALSRIGEEDEDELDEVNGNGTMSGTSGSGSGDLGDSRPLWLQSRRQSRNLMWT
ncbi:hypothetical protein SLS53_007703 [Cytospora paraplurivora]|uniref:Uncharacterized protein n=1 Tax=Cytospora paraplurivora TaxID=2898453 RepID=A0AAN9U0K3_9PEZI